MIHHVADGHETRIGYDVSLDLPDSVQLRREGQIESLPLRQNQSNRTSN